MTAFTRTGYPIFLAVEAVCMREMDERRRKKKTTTMTTAITRMKALSNTFFFEETQVLILAMVSWNDWHRRVFHDLLRGRLGSHRVNRCLS